MNFFKYGCIIKCEKIKYLNTLIALQSNGFGGAYLWLGIVIDVDIWLNKYIVLPLNVFPTERRGLKIIRAFIMPKMLRSIKEQDVNVIMIQTLK